MFSLINNAEWNRMKDRSVDLKQQHHRRASFIIENKFLESLQYYNIQMNARSSF